MAKTAAVEEKTVVPSAGPAAPAARRIEALDFVRGVALCGILLLNIVDFGLPDAYTNPQNSGGATGVNLLTWVITEIGFEGTQRALFSMLFGASVILFTSRLEAQGRADAADIYMRRNLWLVGFGMINAFLLLWHGDILYSYGIVALFVFAFRKLAAKWLLMVGLAALLAGAAWNHSEARGTLAVHAPYPAAAAGAAAARAVEEDPTEAQETAIADWEAERAEYISSPETIAEKIRNHTSGYRHTFGYMAGVNVTYQTYGLYRYFFDVFGMMMIGMALFRLGVLTLERSRLVYVAMMLGGYAVGLATNAWETKHIMDNNFSRDRLRRGKRDLRSRAARHDDRPSRGATSVRADRHSGLRAARLRGGRADGDHQLSDALGHLPRLLHHPRQIWPARAPPALLRRRGDLALSADLQLALAQGLQVRAGRVAVAQPDLYEAPADAAA